MKLKESPKYVSGIGFFDVLTIVFIVLKLVGVIDWSWLWVLSPVWIAALIAIVIALFGGFFRKRKKRT